jgi:hypothetical protein
MLVSLHKQGCCQEVSWPGFYDAKRDRSCVTVVLQLSQFFLPDLHT